MRFFTYGIVGAVVARLLLDIGVPGSNPGRVSFNVMLHAIFFLFVYDFSLYPKLYFILNKLSKIFINDKSNKARRSPIQNFKPRIAKNLLT